MNRVQMLVRTLLRPNTNRFAPTAEPNGHIHIQGVQGLPTLLQKWFCSSVFRHASSPQLLAPPLTTLVPSAGFKVKHALRRRCKDCFFVFRHERMLVLCRTHPRHKQITPARKPRYTWQITHASQSKIRPW